MSVFLSKMIVFQSIPFLVLGLIFGSFVSALTWRIPREISIAKGRSMCPNCKKQIAWYDNIPLLGFIFLMGKCRNCGKKISFRYPIIEFLVALGFLTIYLITFESLLTLVFSLIIFLILISIFVIDLEERIIPDPLVFMGIVISVVYFLLIDPTTIVHRIFAGLIAGVLLLLVHLITRGHGMGLGDVKFAVLGGFLVGMDKFLIWLLLAFLTGAVVGIILILGKKAKIKSKIAFGPFLVLAIPITLCYGEKILFWLHIS